MNNDYTKQMDQFEQVGHRITGDRRLGCSPGKGYESAVVAINDSTRLAYVEVLPDEKQASMVSFLLRAVNRCDRQGITCKRVLSDIDGAYCSRLWREGYRALLLIRKRTRPYTTRSHGEAELFIKTLLTECA